ncbi:MAG: hypothetical protein HPKKFMNG_02666 [Planctomycetes bacterium]|nr:hypothetical protein [Planctomycetota bacterium]
MPRLVFKKGEQAPVEMAGPTVLGRSSDQAQIAIKDNRLSRAHCRFEPREDGQWAIVDLGSQNGTFLNGRRVRESVVRPGDVVTIGQCDILFEATGGPSGSDLMAGVASTRINATPAGGPAMEPAEDNPNSTRTVVAPAALALIQGTLKDKIFPLLKDEFVIGRKAPSDLILEGDTKASGQHAKITRKDATTWVIEDLKSTNGVTVNGHKVTEAVVLKNGAKIIVGLQTFQFTLQGKPPETTGVTAPMSAKEVQQKLAKAQAAEAAPPMDLGDPSIGEKSETLDRQALNVDVKGGGGGGLIFSILEVVLALAVVGMVLGGGYMLLQESPETVGGGGTTSESRDGGLLQAANSSMDKLDAAGMPEGWSFDPVGGDSVSMTEASRGGAQAVQLTRFNASNSISYLFSAPIEVKGIGLKASVFAVNSELSAGRTGTALLSLFWYKDFRDPAIARTPLAAATNLTTWTELKGASAVPQGAKYVRLALGITGKSGSVVFDDALLQDDSTAPAAAKAASVELKNRLRWTLDENGVISLLDRSVVLLRNGVVMLHQADGRADPLDPRLLLLAPPAVISGESGISVKYQYFDPIAEKPVELRIELGENASQATLNALFSPGGADKAASRLALSFVATPAFVPSELVRLEGERVADYRREMPEEGQRINLSTALAADTGTGNRLEALNSTSPLFEARAGSGGRELFFQGPATVQLGFSLGGGREELAQLAALASALQTGETQLDRLARALTIFRTYPYNQRELTIAGQACDSAATHYKLRHLELRDGINVPDLRRNEGLYIAAMDECISVAEQLRARQPEWADQFLPLLRGLETPSMSDVTQRAARQARGALEDLLRSADDFEALSRVAKRARFWLRVSIEQRDSGNLLASAQDFLESGLSTQGRIKLRTIVESYPRCLNGISAKSLMVEQAEAVYAEALQRRAEGLNQIAGALRQRCKEYLDLVEANLLTSPRVLTTEERGWLTRPDEGSASDPRNWLELENKIADRIKLLREKLAK